MRLMDRYSDEEFKKIILLSFSYKECLFNLGYHSSTGVLTSQLKEKINRLEIDTSHFMSKTPVALTEKDVFKNNSAVTQKTVRTWYFKGKYTKYECSICHQKPIWNGKELTMILDHINGYNKDNRLENLRWVCPNCNQQLETTGAKNINHGQHKITTCIDCGTPISKASIRCINCEIKRRTNPVVKGISREELKQLIRTTSFVAIGNKYNVSDNAVRKWCDKYGLPRKVSEIRSYSNEEWEKI